MSTVAGSLLRRGLRTTAAAVLVVLATAGTASAVDGSIVDVERTDPGLQLTVDVPAGADVDLSGVTASIAPDGDDPADYDATATRIADGDVAVQRTTVLAIDTSGSMQNGGRFEAAKAAATAFLDTVPDDVRVGIVSFDADVEVELEPTTDRDEARAALDDLELDDRTQLYNGVLEALALTGDEGQRSVLLLSDGADSGRVSGSDTTVDDVTEAIDDSGGVVVDVVALDQAPEDLGALRTIADASGGQVVSSDSGQLEDIFSAQADVLQRQVAVAVDVPSDVADQQLSVRVVLPSSLGDVVAESTVPAVGGADGGPSLDSVPQEAGAGGAASTPDWLIYVGVGVFALGLLLALVLLVPRRPVAMSAEDRVSTYTASTFGSVDLAKHDEPEPAITRQATEAIAGVLDRNKSLDDRIAQRLEAAGSELKSSEWLLVHAGLFLAIATVGLLLGRGNLVVGLLFMVLGAVGPWLYLGFRASRRRKAFDAALPETLQLMSGSLSAGLSLMQSVDTIVREGAEPIASAFRRVLVETRIGVSLEDALDGVADRFDSRDFRWVVMAIRIQRQVGGNLAELLNTVAATMREREYMRRQVAALAAEGKLSAVVLGGLPPAFLLYLLAAQGDYVNVLFTDLRGIIMISGAGLWLLVGIFWMSKLTKVEV